MMTTNNEELLSVNVGDTILFTYKNWLGEVSKRKVKIEGFIFGANEFHKEPQFMIKGFDLDKSAIRTFAMQDISELKVINNST